MSRSQRLACHALLIVEVIGCVAMWVAIPTGWMWIGAQVYEATLSIFADLCVALVGFIATSALAMSALNRLDFRWIELRRRAGHDQRDGALTQVVIYSAGIGLAAFYVWFHFIEQAFVLQFMPTN